MREEQVGHRRVTALVGRGTSKRCEAAPGRPCVHVSPRRKKQLRNLEASGDVRLGAEAARSRVERRVHAQAACANIGATGHQQFDDRRPSLSWGFWIVSWRPKEAFLTDFATLLEAPELVDGLEKILGRRAFLKGEFRGRKVVVLLQNLRNDYSPNLILSMETHAPMTMDTFDFADYRSDRDGEVALFALEVKHEFMLRHEEGCLKARWAPHKMTWRFFDFNIPPFDRQKCRSVLEAMDALAGSIERRAGTLREAVSSR
jgi:hypothetical protein